MSRKNITAEKVSAKAQDERFTVEVNDTAPEQEKPVTDLAADAFRGNYRVSTALNVREQGKGDARIVGVLNIGTIVSCDGVYAMDNGIRYLHIITDLDNTALEGYCQVRFLIKQ